ncbi:MAG: D-glycero-beta-D-manno-heptose-7-phosphate kinase, partial [Thermodesulfovibrionia bacterium]|nr:D-glycero-beta-D-manno-heptose-7-phosphate kinase [Thermodesulfovibrionia bacterium]
SNMKNLFKKISNTGVLVIGDIMVDHYIRGKVKRISPEAPVPVVEVTEENILLGGAANVAHNIQSLGGKVFISGVVGNDNMGEILTGKFREKGIQTDGIIIEQDRATTVKTRIIGHNQQVVRFDKETRSEISNLTLKRILEYVVSCLPKIKAIIVSDYCKGVITKNLIKKLLGITNSSVFIAVDPKIGHFDYYNRVSLITPNVNEASFGSGVNIEDENSLIKAGKVLLKKLQCRAVLITRGDEGMSLFEKNGKVTHIPTFAKEVYDVTGAGDTVIAVFTLCHSAGTSLKDAAIFANRAAGIVVGEVGTTVVTPEKIISSTNMSKEK